MKLFNLIQLNYWAGFMLQFKDVAVFLLLPRSDFLSKRLGIMPITDHEHNMNSKLTTQLRLTYETECRVARATTSHLSGRERERSLDVLRM